MQPHTFDTLTRRLVKPGSRRAFVAAIGTAFIARPAKAASVAAQAPAACGAAGATCTLILGCCDGMTCATSYLNPSYGVCVSGGGGGMLPVAASVIAPESDGIETLLQAALTTSATAATTVTDPNADQQARKAARKSKRSGRRTTRKSRNNTQQTERKTRRDSHQLNHPPELSLESFTGLENNGQDDEDGSPTEALRISSLDSSIIVISSVSSTLNPSLSSSVGANINPGGVYLLLSGVSGDTASTPDAALAKLWTEDFVCTDGLGGTPIEGAGYTIVALQSGATTSHEFTVLCNELQTYGSLGNGNSHHKKHHQQSQHHHKRQQQKKQHKNNGGK
jgi:hypothetical protein